jgi:hypothetical protein
MHKLQIDISKYQYSCGGIVSIYAGMAEDRATVPRFFFNVVEGHSKNLAMDSEGAVFSGLSEANKEAVGLAQDFANHDFHGPTQSWKIVVADENRNEVLTVSLSEIRPRKMIQAWAALGGRIAKFESGIGQHILVWLVAAAMLAIIVHAAMPVTEKGSSYTTASAPTKNAIVAVRFVPHASVADITKLLDAYKATLVDGPRAGGFYSLRVADTTLPEEEFTKIVGRIAQEEVIEFAAVVQ